MIWMITGLKRPVSSSFVRPEGIALGSYGLCAGLIALSAIEIGTVAPGPQADALLPLLAILLAMCTVELFVSKLKHFFPAAILQIIAVLAVGVSSAASMPTIEMMVMTVLILSMVLRLPPRISLPLCLAVMIVPPLLAYVDGVALHAALLPLGVELVVLALAHRVIRYREDLVAARQSLERERESVENLSAANDSLLRHLPEMKEESAEKERFRITRELHDTLGYSMTNIAMIMNAAQYLIQSDPQKVSEYCSRTRELASSTMDETRSTLYKLRELGRRTPENPAIFFYRLCRDFHEATGVTVECRTGNLAHRLPKRVFDTMLRTVQVAFINALKHGNTTRIELYIWVGHHELTMTIWNSMTRDRSDSPETPRDGIGLSGMRERLEELEGSVETALVRDGFNLVIRIPQKELVDGTDTSSDSR
jgi:signal transduction histidine kinase